MLIGRRFRAPAVSRAANFCQCARAGIARNKRETRGPMKQHALAFIALAAAAGCATGDRHHAARLAALTGAGEEAVKSALGDPTRIDRASDGRMLWTYYKSASRSWRRDYGLPGFTDASGPASRAAGETAVFICVTTVRFNAEGRVEATDFKGESCF